MSGKIHFTGILCGHARPGRAVATSGNLLHVNCVNCRRNLAIRIFGRDYNPRDLGV